MTKLDALEEAYKENPEDRHRIGNVKFQYGASLFEEEEKEIENYYERFIKRAKITDLYNSDNFLTKVA